MERIRQFEERDILQVASLHHAVFRTKIGPEDKRYRAYFSTVFIHRPATCEDLPSLVCEGVDGRISGFIGVVGRRLSFRHRQLRVAVSSQFMVEPNESSGLIAIGLARRFLAGPQDLSLADEANDKSWRLWARLGGTSLPLQSIHWVLPILPARLCLFAARHRRFTAWAKLLSPLVGAADALAARLPGMPLSFAPSKLRAEELHAATLSRLISEFAGNALRPEYSSQDLERILAWAVQRSSQGRFRRALLRTQDGQKAGWYIYHRGASGVADLLQIGGKEDTISDVLNHLLLDAWKTGAHCVTGRMEPLLVSALAGRLCLMRRSPLWILLHSRDPELQSLLQRGDAFLSRLDGEWSVRFQ